jgi:hypothetical protein
MGRRAHLAGVSGGLFSRRRGRFGGAQLHVDLHLVCWAKNRRLVLNEVKPNVPIDPIHVYPALVEVRMLVCWASLRSASIYKNHATAPEFQPPAYHLLPVILLWPGSWLTPIGWLPNQDVTERSLTGKRELVISRTRSIN